MVYYKRGEIGLAHVHKVAVISNIFLLLDAISDRRFIQIDRKKLDADLYKGLISCQTLELETIPSCRRIRRLVEEVSCVCEVQIVGQTDSLVFRFQVLVVDRGFSIGETVIKFENENAGDPVKEHMCIPRSDAVIGQVMNVEVIFSFHFYGAFIFKVIERFP